jgi:DNA-binding winged helix-turn-helix (wHTH) protein
MRSPRQLFRFGEFDLDLDAGELRRAGRLIRLQPQPFKLLALVVRRAGTVVTREEIRSELWAEGTFVDFDQAVNFAVKQVRDAIGDAADRPVYLQTVPKRGYKFIAPVEQSGNPRPAGGPDTIRLQKALWANIAELRMAQERYQRRTIIAFAAGLVVALGLLVYFLAIR